MSLLGTRFDDGVEFTFDHASIQLLAPGERVLVVRNLAAFTMRYGPAAAARVAGEFLNGTGLSNDGEQVVIAGPGGTVRDFTYNDQAPWPTAADGDGPSLVLVAPTSNPDHNDAANWRASATLGGTPGSGEGDQGFAAWAATFGGITADFDGDADGRSALLEYAQGTDPTVAEDGGGLLNLAIANLAINGGDDYLILSFRRDPAAADAVLTPQLSGDVAQWAAAGEGLVPLSEEDLGDGTTLVTYRSAQPFSELPAELFARLEVSLP